MRTPARLLSMVILGVVLGCSGEGTIGPGGSREADGGDDETEPTAVGGGHGTGAGGVSAGGSSSGVATTGMGGAGGAAGAGGDIGCDYELIYGQPGEVLQVTEQQSIWSVQPKPNQGFFCVRFEFDMQTADSLSQIVQDGGCPIFTSLAGITGPNSQLAGGLFKIHKAQSGCPIGPTRLEIDTFADALVEPHPYVLGEAYRMVIEVVPHIASLTLFQNGQQVGQTVSASVEGATVADTVGAVFTLGLEKPLTNAYWPNYGAVYSNVAIYAEMKQ